MTDDLVERLRGDWPEILVEKHWMMDSDAIDKQRAEAADRIEALEAALSWALIQLGSETGYNMESPIWHAYDRARSVLNGEKQ